MDCSSSMWTAMEKRFQNAGSRTPAIAAMWCFSRRVHAVVVYCQDSRVLVNWWSAVLGRLSRRMQIVSRYWAVGEECMKSGWRVLAKNNCLEMLIEEIQSPMGSRSVCEVPDLEKLTPINNRRPLSRRCGCCERREAARGKERSLVRKCKPTHADKHHLPCSRACSTLYHQIAIKTTEALCQHLWRAL